LSETNFGSRLVVTLEKYRQKLKVSRETEAQTNETQISEVLRNVVTPSTSDPNPSDRGSALSTPRRTRSSSASSGKRLIVHLDFGSYARRRLDKRKGYNVWLKQERSGIWKPHFKLQTDGKKCCRNGSKDYRYGYKNTYQYSLHSLKKSGISHRKLPRKFFKSIMLANVLFHEVKSKKQKI